MNINKIDDVRKLFESKKNSFLESDKERVELLEDLLKNDNLFFDIDASTAIGILSFLGIKDEELEECYFNLIKPTNFLETDKPYIIMNN